MGNSSFFVVGTGVRSIDFWKKYESQVVFDLWLESLKEASLIGVRGPLSKQYLESFGIYARLIGDPVLFLALDSVYEKPMSKKLLVNLGTAHGKLWGSEEYFYKVMLDVLLVLVEDGWSLDFYSVWPEDNKIIKGFVSSLIAKSKFFRRCKIYEAYSMRIEEAVSVITDYDVFIGEKLHAVIAAHCSYTPTLIFEYRPKCLDYAFSVGMEKYCLRTDQVSVNKVLYLINDLYINVCHVQRELFDNIKKLNFDRESFLDELLQKLY